MKKISAISILAALLASALTLSTATAQESDLEQISPQDLEQLQGIIKFLEESPASQQTAASGNDFVLDLIWQAHTLTPADYPGKALPSMSSWVVVQALANTANPGGLTYTWVIDDSSSTRDGPELQGAGRDRFSFLTHPIPGFTHKIRVTAQNEASGERASASLEFKTQAPRTNLYWGYNSNHNNPASSFLDLAPGEEASLLARAFFFNTQKLNDLNFTWSLNGQTQTMAGSQPNLLPIKVSDRTASGIYLNLKLDVKPKGEGFSPLEYTSSRTQISVQK